jgi:hypothetical protein
VSHCQCWNGRRIWRRSFSRMHPWYREGKASLPSMAYLQRLVVLNGLRDGLSPSRTATQWSMSGKTVQRLKSGILDYPKRVWSRPSLDVAFVAVCDAVLMALKGEGRSPLPRSLSDSASARLTQNLAGSQRGREGLAVSCPIEFRANLRRRAKPGVDLLSAIRIRFLNRPVRRKPPASWQHLRQTVSE